MTLFKFISLRKENSGHVIYSFIQFMDSVHKLICLRYFRQSTRGNGKQTSAVHQHDFSRTCHCASLAYPCELVKVQGVWKKSLPEKSWIKSAVLCVLLSFLIEFISRLWEVSGECFSQIDSLYQLWWDFKEMCKKRQKSEVPVVVHCAAAFGGDLGDSLAIAILNSITVSGSRTCVRFSLNITRRKKSNGDGSGEWGDHSHTSMTACGWGGGTRSAGGGHSTEALEQCGVV